MRAALDAAHEEEPPFWAALREPGWLGLHVAEANGGAGFGLVEQAVVIEELGRAARARSVRPDRRSPPRCSTPPVGPPQLVARPRER